MIFDTSSVAATCKLGAQEGVHNSLVNSKVSNQPERPMTLALLCRGQLRKLNSLEQELREYQDFISGHHGNANSHKSERHGLPCLRLREQPYLQNQGNQHGHYLLTKVQTS